MSTHTTQPEFWATHQPGELLRLLHRDRIFMQLLAPLGDDATDADRVRLEALADKLAKENPLTPEMAAELCAEWQSETNEAHHDA